MSPPPPPGVSVSTIAATATASTGCHMLKFEGYKLLKKMHSDGQYVRSCAFEAAGHTWRIYCYPNNRYSGNSYISLSLVLDSFGAMNVQAEVKFSLLRRRGQPRSRSIVATFRYGEPLGFDRFISSGKLESRRSGFLEDDCLAVRCDITVLEKSAEQATTAVQARDLELLGIVCDCTDELCKRHHVRATPPEPRKSFLKLFCFRS
ncbi:hypothetical protein EJB05_12386, partial [Eragrostis curvula]